MGLELEYANCLTLTVIPPATYTTAETNVPVMVRIGRSAGKYRDDTSDVFSKLGPSYQKMAISLDDDVTECPVEVKDWDVTRQLGILFVKIPAIPTTGTTLKLWYDPTHTDNANVGAVGSAAGQSVWSNGFAGVWHKPSGGLLLDSTANANHGTIYGATETDGPLGRCLSFDGVDDVAVIPDDASLDAPIVTVDVYTFARADTPGSYLKRIVGKKQSWADGYGYYLTYGWNSDLRFRLGPLSTDPDAEIVLSGNTPWESWYHFTGVYDGGIAYGYIDGVPVVSKTIGSISLQNTNPVTIGGIPGGTAWYDGTISYVAISSVARSPAWIALTNTSLKDELIAFSEPGSESLSGTERMRLTPDGTLIANEFVEV